MTTPDFEDHFSHASDDYAAYRPVYPDALYAWLARNAPQRRFAWDCATGSGQAALELARFFDRVVASDASAEQIASAQPAPNVTYAVYPAEDPALDDTSVDLITVAQALHWFDFPRFFDQARRVLVPDGLLAVWCYEMFRVDAAVDALVDALYRGPLEGYWPPGRRYIEAGYRNIPFPEPQIAAPSFEMTARWTLEQVLGYLGTWSAVKRYRDDHGLNPLDAFAPDLARAWGDAGPRRLVWPLTLLVTGF